MRLHDLTKITDKENKRLGRGPGSGKGKTAGRGMKGQKARSKVKAGFEGGQLKLLRRLPFLRGIGFKSHKPKPETISIKELNVFENATTVTERKLIEQGIVDKKRPGGFKILSNGQLTKKINLEGIAVSQEAQEKIETQGGKVIKH